MRPIAPEGPKPVRPRDENENLPVIGPEKRGSDSFEPNKQVPQRSTSPFPKDGRRNPSLRNTPNKPPEPKIIHEDIDSLTGEKSKNLTPAQQKNFEDFDWSRDKD